MSKLILSCGLCLGSMSSLFCTAQAIENTDQIQSPRDVIAVAVEKYGPFNKNSAQDFANDLRGRGLRAAVEQDPSGAYWVYTY